MSTMIKQMKLIYHLTSLENIESIFNRGLLAREFITKFDDVADQEIIDKRKKLGILNSIPFHLYYRNPFDYRVQTDNKEKHFVYITILRELARLNGFRIIPRHPLACNEDEIYSFDVGMSKIEWDIMESKDYKNAYPRSVCMAECLGPEIIPTKDFAFIYSKNNADQNYLTSVAQKCIGSYTFSIAIRPDYFF